MKNKYRIFLLFVCLLGTQFTYGQYHIKSISNATGGQCNGSIEVEVDPANAPHTFRWNVEGETDAIINGLCPGIYAVVIEDKYGCSWELEAEMGKDDGCYIQSEVFQAEITHVCEQVTGGSIFVTANSAINYTYTWNHGVDGPYAQNLSLGEFTVTIRDASDNSCFTTKTYTVETRMDCGPEPPVESIPLFINEFYNGTGSQSEYVELIVKGDGTCNPVDLRGFIIDDNNGDFSNPLHGICGTGFSGGHIRFKSIARWAAVTPGSKIVLYNPAAKNGAINITDDPIDENGDGIYVLPVSDSGMEGTHLFPSYSNPSYNNEDQEVIFAEAKWAYIALKDDKDAMQLRYPDGNYCHGISFGDATFINGGPADLQISTTGTVGEVVIFNDGSVNEISNFSSSTELSPSAANNALNTAYLNGIACTGGSLIVNELGNNYVELLVISNSNCGLVDLRGYIVDDNNGDFSNEIDGSGISPGHLRFPYTDIWSEVKGGSLIVIYNEKEAAPSGGGGEDVYILPATDLEGSAATPTATKPYDYDLNASYGIGSWDYIDLFIYGDAMQVVAPDGSYQHGISYGSLGNINGGPNGLLIEMANNNGKVYYFNDTNPKLVANFDVGTNSTVGAANNATNQAYIETICAAESAVTPATSRSATPKQLSARLYPNPFSNIINIEVSSPKSQEVVIHLHDFLGRLLYERKEGLKKGYNDLTIDLEQHVSDGIYYMSIRADKEVLHEEKLIRVHK